MAERERAGSTAASGGVRAPGKKRPARRKKRKGSAKAIAARRRVWGIAWLIVAALMAAGAVTGAILADDVVRGPILWGLAGACAALGVLGFFFRKFRLLLPFALAACLIAGVMVERTNVSVNDRAYTVFAEELTLEDKLPDDLNVLRRLSHLRDLDVRALTLTQAQVDELKAIRPLCEVHYSVSVDGVLYDAETTQSLAFGGTYAEADVLSRFYALQSVDLHGADMTGAEKVQLQARYPDIAFSWSVPIAGGEYESDTAALDLSGGDVGSMSALTAALDGLPALRTLDVRGTGMISEDLLALRSRYPDLELLCEVNLAGKAFDSAGGELVLDGINVTDVDAFADALGLFHTLNRVSLKDSSLTNEQIEDLMARYPDTRFVWNITFGEWTMPTDCRVFSGDMFPETNPRHGRYSSEEYDVLKYCTDLIALDLGHNKITDIGFLSGLTNLKILILADNQITDISPIANLTQLRYTELFLNSIVDLSPLSDLRNLTDLNVYANPTVKDVSPLYGMTWLKRLWFGFSELQDGQKKSLSDALPDCRCSFANKGATRDGWRDSDKYDFILEVFTSGVIPDEW